MPIKLFSDGEVLSADEVNTYLMDQAVSVFANAAARDLAFSDVDPSKPSRGAGGRLCYLIDPGTVQYWNGTIWQDSSQFTVPDNFITNAKINSSAAIAYSKLNISNSVVNADISSSAAIADSKLATISTAGKVSNTATTATSSNTINAIVARDSSGNFSAGAITATSASVSGALTGASATLSGAMSAGSATITGTTEIQQIFEKATINAGAGSSTINFDVQTSAVVVYEGATTTGHTVNLRGSSGSTLDSLMSTGQSVTIVLILNSGSTAGKVSSITVDTTGTTSIKWFGGTSYPSGSGSNAYDVYTITAMKKTTNSWLVFASQSRFG
jgi:hypothetical protein